tara:strand:- start:251 stop:652 length:402 start_codon:yes stop_codon:yes gene_type:complete
MKVGIVGSRKFENRLKIKDFIFKLKEKYGEDVVIVSGGCRSGADKYAKCYALELGVQYEEYPPFHENKSLYCPLPEKLFNKPYHVSNFFARNKLIAQNSDKIIAFIPEGHISNGTMSTVNYAKKMNKDTVIVN